MVVDERHRAVHVRVRARVVLHALVLLAAGQVAHVEATIAVHHAIEPVAQSEIEGAHQEIIAPVLSFHAQYVVVEVGFAAHVLAHVKHGLAAIGPAGVILQVEAQVLLGGVAEVLHRVPTEAVDAGLLFHPHYPVAGLGLAVALGLGGVVGGRKLAQVLAAERAVAVVAAVVAEAEIGAEKRAGLVAAAALVPQLGVEVGVVFWPAALAGGVGRAAVGTLGHGRSKAAVAEGFVAAVGGHRERGLGVLAGIAGAGAGTVHMVQHHVLNDLDAVGVQHGHHAQELILRAKAGARIAFLVLVAQVVGVEGRVAHVVGGVFVFGRGRNPHRVDAEAFEAGGQLGEVIGPLKAVGIVVVIPPKCLEHHFLGRGLGRNRPPSKHQHQQRQSSVTYSHTHLN